MGFTKTWKRKVWAAVWPLRPPEPLKKARLTLTRHSSVRPDSDNLTFSFKAIIDGLVEARVLEDDSFKHIGFPDYRWEKAKKSEGHVSIKVEELESNLEFGI
jgi:Holliday junction resolvase RusA-like endonuclease